MVVVTLNDQLCEKERAKKFLANIISIYLENLQNGKYEGIPTMEELNAAGALHEFLESVNLEN